MSAAERVRRLIERRALDLPPIGEGRTRDRWRRLAAIARCDVSTARLAEGHADGVQILREAGRANEPNRMLGVWASESPKHTLRVERDRRGLHLRGSKAFCTGAPIVDAALVTATSEAGRVLLLVPVHDLALERIDPSAWRAYALRDTGTATVDLDGVTLPADAQIGTPDWYFERPGFWSGAVGPAACWAGAAFGLVDHALEHRTEDPHALAHHGALATARWTLTTVLDAAGDETDRSPGDASRAQERALMTRHVVDETCATIQDRFGRALGPRALAFDGDLVERYDALTIYRRQCHAEQDLETLGALLPTPAR